RRVHRAGGTWTSRRGRRRGERVKGRKGDETHGGPTVAKITTHSQLDVYRKAFDTAMRIFRLSKKFPKEEIYSLTDQIRKSSRSVCSNLAEAWRKRRYEAAFISKLSDAEAEAGETQSWLEFAVQCEYMTHADG